jgi:hypothetical protein
VAWDTHATACVMACSTAINGVACGVCAIDYTTTCNM